MNIAIQFSRIIDNSVVVVKEEPMVELECQGHIL